MTYPTRRVVSLNERRALVILAVLSTVSGSGCAAPDDSTPDPSGSVEGKVVLSAASDHSGALVVIDGTGEVAVSAPDGRFRIAMVTPGLHRVTASRAGYVSARSAELRVEAGLTTAVGNLELTAMRGVISGSVRKEGSTNPSGVTVKLLGTTDAVITGDDGTFAFSGVQVGTHFLEALAEGYEPARSSPLLLMGDVPIDAGLLVLPRARGALTGTASLVDDSDHSGILVTLQGTSHATLTEPGGAYGFDAVPVGQYTVVATRTEYESASATDQTVLSQQTTSVPALWLTPVASDCGNGVKEPIEECDGLDLGGQSCLTLGKGYTGGWLGCEACALEESRCSTCGNGVTEVGEACDDGDTEDDLNCSADCQSFCGDGVLDPRLGETCDEADANGLSPNRCLENCTLTVCGDGHLGGAEECDDSNVADGDGCSSLCMIEPRWECIGSPSTCTCSGNAYGPNCSGCVVFVSRNAAASAPDGRSWATAFGTLQPGIDTAHAAGPTCDVWVAEGRYGIYSGSPMDTVMLRSGVSLYGGFFGNEIAREQRDATTNVTVLDGRAASGAPGQVFHVLTAIGTADATVDGFTVTGGAAIGAWEFLDMNGAGLFAYGASNLTFQRCRFAANATISWGSGAGAYVFFGSELQFNHCLFADNQAGSGGGVYSDQSSLTFADSSFSGNRSEQRGGGMSAYFSTLDLSGCDFSSNSANLGGGLYSESGSSLRVTGSVFSGNSATGYGGSGGAMQIHSSVHVLLNNVFAGNTATDAGGGIVIGCGRTTIGNCTLAANWADWGGGVHTTCGDPDLQVVNSILWDNVAASDGASFHLVGFNGTFSLTYSDVEGWGDHLDQHQFDADPQFAATPQNPAVGGTWTTVDYDLPSSQTVLTAGTDVFDGMELRGRFVQPDVAGDPRWFFIAASTARELRVWGDLTSFVDPGDPFAVYDLRLGSSSPCIDVGDDTANRLPTDIDGNPWREIPGLGGTVSTDLGAYDYVP